MKPPIEEMLEQQAGREMYNVGAGIEAPPESDYDDLMAEFGQPDTIGDPNAEPLQADLGSWMARMFGKRGRRKPIRRGPEAAPTPPPGPDMGEDKEGVPKSLRKIKSHDMRKRADRAQDPRLSHEERAEFSEFVDAQKQKELARRDWRRNVNLDYLDTTDDVHASMEAIARKYIDEVPHESLSEIQQDVLNDPDKYLAPILQGKKGEANLTSRQLLAGRQLLVNIHESLADLQERINKKGSEAASPEDYLEFDRLQNMAVTFQSYMQGEIRETARALNAMKVVARTLKSSSKDKIMQAASEGGSQSVAMRAKIYRSAMKHAEGMDDAEALGYLSYVNKMMARDTRMRSLVNLWTASILTGPVTHAVNLTSNATIQILETGLVRPVSVGIGILKQPFAKNKKRNTITGNAAELLGMMHAIPEATVVAGRSFIQGIKDKGTWESSFGEVKTVEIQRRTALPGEALGSPPVLGKMLDMYGLAVETMSYGVLNMGDEFFKTIAYRKMMYQLTADQASREGKHGKALRDRMGELMSGDLANMSTADRDLITRMNERAIQEAERETFTNRPDGMLGMLAEGFSNTAEEYPALKMVAPFVRTPTNIMHYAMDLTPLGAIGKKYKLAMAKGGPEADEVRARIAVGTTIMASMAILHQQGYITGNGPKDMEQRAALEATGWRPNSILIDGKYWRYNRGADPLGANIGVMANLLDSAAYAQTAYESEEMFAMSIFGMAEYMTDTTYLSGIGEVLRLVHMGGAGAGRFAARTLSGFVPNFFKTIGKLVDETERTTYPSYDFTDSLNSYVDGQWPTTRDELLPVRNWDGEMRVPIGSRTMPMHIYNQLSPFVFSEAIDDPGSNELAVQGVRIPKPKMEIRFEGITLPLGELPNWRKHYDRMTVLMGQQRRKYVEKTIASKRYKALPEHDNGPGSNRNKELSDAIRKGGADGKDQFLLELFKGVKKDPAEYGAMAMILDPATLDRVIRSAHAGTLTVAEKELIKTIKAKVPQDRRLPDVPHMRDLPWKESADPNEDEGELGW